MGASVREWSERLGVAANVTKWMLAVAGDGRRRQRSGG